MLAEGMFIADRYEVIGKIGAGGMSDVYKAKDLTLGRYVAIKVLKAEFSEDLGFVTKFRSEAQSAAGLEHPNIVNIYDVGSEKGLHYIVMEYVEGITLKTYIEKKGQLSFKEAVSIAIQVGRGIEAAHNKGIIHRDIKPQNIIISTEGKVKVTDFGIARAASSNTISSDVMGSVHYASPEQARNGFVDGKSDIYSLGIVMYEMVTGRVPFDGDTTVAVAIQHLQEEMVVPSVYAPNLPISLERIILKCTQKNPDRRYESMTEVLNDLRKALVSPNEDFVVMAPVTSQDKTRVIGEDELRQIREESDVVRVREEEPPRPRREEEPRPRYEEEEEEDDDEELGDDGDLSPKLEKAITIMGIAAALVIIVLIIALVINLFGGFRRSGGDDSETMQTEQTETQTEEGEASEQEEASEGASEEAEPVEVPSVLGMSYEEAERALEALGLGIEDKGEVSSADYEEGKIANQEPEEGEKADPGSVVSVVISNGPGTLEVPDVVGKELDDAVSELEEFEINRTYAYSSDVPEGTVISQNPSGGGQAKAGDTVTLEISKGRQPITVPDVMTTYKTEQQARELLEGLEVSVDSAYSDTIPEGIVMNQSIAAGKEVEYGSAITITISKGPEKPVNVQPDTYKFSATIDTDRIDSSQVSGADIVLYDANGNQLEAWFDQPIGKLGKDGKRFEHSGIMTSSGKLFITWLDKDGNEYSTQSIDMEFQKS